MLKNFVNLKNIKKKKKKSIFFFIRKLFLYGIWNKNKHRYNLSSRYEYFEFFQEFHVWYFREIFKYLYKGLILFSSQICVLLFLKGKININNKQLGSWFSAFLIENKNKISGIYIYIYILRWSLFWEFSNFYAGKDSYGSK